VFPKKLTYGILNPQIHWCMIFQGRTLERYLGLDEVMRVGPHDGISGFVRRGRETEAGVLLCLST
jgi:hypothetical protein